MLQLLSVGIMVDRPMSEDTISTKLNDQRLRSRFIDVIELLAGGDDTVNLFGFGGYFNWFFDYFTEDGNFVPLSSMSFNETAAAKELLKEMLSAAEATPQHMTEAEFIASGWPTRIQLIARRAMDTFLVEGRCAE